MELWIRSQEKDRILKVDDIRYELYGNTNREYCIIANNHYLGFYNSKKQCLEILDEIQKMLVPVLDSDGHMVDYTSNIVYEMPEDKGESYD